MDKKCRISGKPLKEVFNLGNLYVSNFVKKTTKDNIKEEMKLMFCEESKLLQFEKNAPSGAMFGKYWYRSGINDSMRRDLKNIVDSTLDCVSYKKGDVWLDIACNDGTLLSFVPDTFYKVGIDPVEDSFKIESEKHADVIVQDYFSKKSYDKATSKKAKIVTLIAMFYDLDQPNLILDDIYKIMDDDGIFVMQLSYTPLMVKQLAFDNICHEHLTYYSLYSMEYVLKKSGFKVVDCELNDVNGGSFRVYIRKDKSDDTKFKSSPFRDVANFRLESLRQYEQNIGANTFEFYKKFYDDILKLKEQTVEFIKNEVDNGKIVWAYGASTKGNTLLQWYGLDSKLISGIAERSHYKFGLKTVGTDIPIYSEEEMRKVNPDYLLILPWHFVTNFVQREQEYLRNGGKFIIPCPKFEII